MTARYVVDASVGIKLFLPESYADRAQALFERLCADTPASLLVPDLFYIECANILWKYVSRFHYPESDARKDIANLRALALQSVATRELVESALLLAVRHRITAYDAVYVALAQAVAAPLVTADERLVRAFAGGPHDVRWLGDI